MMNITIKEIRNSTYVNKKKFVHYLIMNCHNERLDEASNTPRESASNNTYDVRTLMIKLIGLIDEHTGRAKQKYIPLWEAHLTFLEEFKNG